uniref:Protein CASP n=1 Tax=Macrostomum lignano TaxID=282301 RepID=A0A1I8F645_9PLAT
CCSSVSFISSSSVSNLDIVVETPANSTSSSSSVAGLSSCCATSMPTSSGTGRSAAGGPTARSSHGRCRKLDDSTTKAPAGSGSRFARPWPDISGFKRLRRCTKQSEQKRQTVVKIVESDRQFASSGRILPRLLQLLRLRQQQQQQRPVGGQFPSGRALERSKQQQYATLPEYDPEMDLEQQILDLQEANETLKLASSPVDSGASGGARVAPTVAENRLRARLDQVTVENEALKNESPSELDVLRDRNYQLERENRRLLETGSPFFAADPYGLAGKF